ncbi:MAG: fatty acid desaturase [Planctomycetota bacterium]
MSTAVVPAPPSAVSEVPEKKRISAREKRQKIENAYAHIDLSRDTIDWASTIWIVGMHVGCLAAPFLFTWSGLIVAGVLHWATMSLGICLAYHRYLSHRSLKLKAPAEAVVTFFGLISGEGPPLWWAATHRLHHQKSDQEGDPHSPNDGHGWSHILWLFKKREATDKQALYEMYASELLDRPVLRALQNYYVFWLLGTAAVLYAAGEFFFGAGLSWLVWGVCVRMVCGYHSTWFINSATHMWGYRNYETRDMSRNLWWAAILSYGEGWHNNHHAHQADARAGHRWFELDPTYWSIKFLKLIGQAYDVKDTKVYSR